MGQYWWVVEMMITRIWREQPGDWFFICTKNKDGRWGPEQAFTPDTFDRVRDFVEAHKHKNIYACPHGFMQPYRRKQYTVLPKLLWADLDDVDPNEMEFEPTIALESSPGRYVGLWQTDRPVTEELNKRLSYHVGADLGGWDLTQVLRLVPRTTNFKYAHEPRVKLLWSNGPTYRVQDLERQLPKMAATAGSRSRHLKPLPDVTHADGVRLARKHSLGMMYLGPCGDRSRAVFKIVEKMSHRGASAAEIFAVVMCSRAAERYEGDKRRAWQDVLRIMSKQAAA